MLNGEHSAHDKIPDESLNAIAGLIITILPVIFAVLFTHCCSSTVNASEVAMLFFVFSEVPCTSFWMFRNGHALRATIKFFVSVRYPDAKQEEAPSR